jgi:hypothetical protein
MRVTSRACLYAWGREPGASLSDAHGGRPWAGGAMRRDFPGASQRRPHALATAWQWLSIHNGGAFRFTNTKDPHRRRKRGAGA